MLNEVLTYWVVDTVMATEKLTEGEREGEGERERERSKTGNSYSLAMDAFITRAIRIHVLIFHLALYPAHMLNINLKDTYCYYK